MRLVHWCVLAWSLTCTSARADVIAIEGVSVISMVAGEERVQRERTVLIEEEKIRAIGAAGELKVPGDARRIAGKGRWLLPGLVDMHAHLLSDDRIADEYAETELDVFLAQGVTTARIPIGHEALLRLRERVEARDVLGPTLFLASPQLAGRSFGIKFNGTVVTDAAEARAAVRAAHESGYDFLKLTFWITPEVFNAAVDEAGKLDIPVIGHVGPQVGLERAIEAGVQIEHLDQFFEALLPEGVPNDACVSGLAVWRPENWPSVSTLDAEAIPALAARVRDAGIWNTPTLSFLNSSFGTGRSLEELRSGPEWNMVSAEVRGDLLKGRERFWSDPPAPELRERYVALRNEITLALHEAGAPIMAGSDAPEWLLLYGFAMHRELEALVEAGLEPWEALEAATVTPSRWLGIADRQGTVAVGQRADLILLRDDPLADISNTRNIDGVFVRGSWLDRARLDAMLETASGRLSQAPLRKAEAR